MTKSNSSLISNKNKGFAMVEVLVSLAIASMLVVAFQILIVQAIETATFSKKSFLATMYLREAIEIAKDLEQSDWGAFPVTCPPPAPQAYHPIDSGGAWELTGGEESLEGGKYTRSIVIEPVLRSQLSFPNTIVSLGGVCDDDTKKVIATINWNDGSTPHAMNLETYIYNFP